MSSRFPPTGTKESEKTRGIGYIEMSDDDDWVGFKGLLEDEDGDAEGSRS
jgi:hypothetical protein